MSAGVCGEAVRASSEPPRTPSCPVSHPHQMPWGQGKLQQEEHLFSLGRVTRKCRGRENNTKTNNGQHLVSTYYV